MTPEFYARPTLDVAAELIGKALVHDVRGKRTAGLIVEVEAYIGEDDPACHAAPGPTKRNAPLYGPPGRAYVYLNYGLHYLGNAVTEPAGSPAAVLIRALEPLEGVEMMARRRGKKGGRASFMPNLHKGHPTSFFDLCRGPGNLTVAMAIDLRQNNGDLWKGKLRIEDRGITPPALEWSRRIGIRVGVEQPWRCVWAGHPAISGASRRRVLPR